MRALQGERDLVLERVQPLVLQGDGEGLREVVEHQLVLGRAALEHQQHRADELATGVAIGRRR